MNSVKQYVNSVKQCVNSVKQWWTVFLSPKIRNGAGKKKKKKVKRKTQTWVSAVSKRPLNVKRVEDYEIKVRADFYHNFWFTPRITETDIIWKIIQNLTIFLKVRLDSWKLKTEKYCNKIIFKCVNSIVRPIFNEKFDKKWYLWICE